MEVKRKDVFDFNLWVTEREYDSLTRLAESEGISVERVITDIVFNGLCNMIDNLE